jgi:hypothetical protein
MGAGKGKIRRAKTSHANDRLRTTQDGGAAAVGHGAASAAGILHFDDEVQLRPLSNLAKSFLSAASNSLLTGLQGEAEKIQEGKTEFKDLPITSQILPSRFSHQYDPEFFKKFTETIVSVRDKLASYPETHLSTTAEELAAQAIMVRSLGYKTVGLEDPNAVTIELQRLHYLAFIKEGPTNDVMALFDSRLDNYDDSEIGEQLGDPGLSVQDWFKPFGDKRFKFPS